MKKHLTLAALVIAALAFAGAARAAAVWNVLDGDWNDPLNWNPQTLPTTVDAIVDNDGIARISADFTTAREVGIGYSGKGNIDAGTGGSGTVYQTAGILDVNGNRFCLGRLGNVGVFYLEGGTLDASPADCIIGANNSTASVASGIIQSGASNSKYKKMLIGDGWDERSDSGSKGYYEMNSSGTMQLMQYELSIANAGRDGATGQKGTFTQTAGTVTCPAGGNSGLRMGAGAGSGGYAILNLDGGFFWNKGPTIFSQPAGNAGVYINITNGTLRLAGVSNLADLTGIANSDFRSFGLDANAENTLFLPAGVNTDITAYELLFRTSGDNTYSTAIALDRNRYIYSDSGTLTLDSGSDITGAYNLKLGGDGNIVVADPIAIGGILAKDGPGTMTFNVANTHTGLTAVVAGTLAYGASDVIATGDVIVFGATAVLDLGADHTDTVGTVTVDGGGRIIGTGASALTSTGTFEMMSGSVGIPLGGDVALNKTTSGTVVLSGANTYTGATTVSGGALQFESVAAIGGAARDVTVNSSGAVAFAAFSDADIATALARIATGSAGAVAADNNGGGAFDFSAAGLTAARLGAVGEVTYTGTLTPNGTTYRLGGGGGTLTYTPAITGANGLIVSGAGSTVVLTGANSYTGETTINGALRVSEAANLGDTSQVRLNAAGAVLDLRNDASTDFGRHVRVSVGESYINVDRAVGGTGTGGAHSVGTMYSAAAMLTVTGDNGFGLSCGAVTANGNAKFNNNAPGLLTLASLTGENANQTVTLGGTGDIVIPGAVTEVSNMKLTKSGAGTLILSGANTYSGLTTVYAGTLAIGNDSAIGSGGLTLGGGAIEAYGDARSVSNTALLTGNSAVVGSYDLGFTGSFTNSGGNRTLTNNLDAGKALTLTGPVNLSEHATTGRTLTITGAGDTTIGGIIGNGGTGAGNLTKAGAGTLVLSGANTYSGNTAVNAGTLQVTGSIDNSAVTVNNAGTVLAGGGSVKSLTVNANAIVAPGDSVGTLDVVAGNASLAAGAIYQWEFGGGTSADLVAISGNLTLNDDWMLRLADAGGTPSASAEYDLFTYTDNYTGLPSFGLGNIDASDVDWDVSAASIVDDAAGRVYITGIGSSALIGDADDNGVVNAADYIALKRHMGQGTGATTAEGDFDGDSDVDWDDLQLLQAHYGETSPGASGTIPEPGSAMLLVFGAAVRLGGLRRRAIIARTRR